MICMVPLLFVQNLLIAATCLSLAFFFAEFTVGPFWAVPMDIAPRFAGSASRLMNTGSALAANLSGDLWIRRRPDGQLATAVYRKHRPAAVRVHPGVLDQAGRATGRAELAVRPAMAVKEARRFEESCRRTPLLCLFDDRTKPAPETLASSRPTPAQLACQTGRLVRKSIAALATNLKGTVKGASASIAAAAPCTPPTPPTIARFRLAW